jgi:hypothetical protein
MNAIGVFAVLGLALGSAPAFAQREQAPADVPPDDTAPSLRAPPDLRLYSTHLFAGRYNPLGLELQNRVMLQKRLLHSDSLLLRDTFVAGGLGLRVSPAFVKVGPVVELQPVAMLHVRAGYEYIRFFRGFNYLQSFPSPLVDVSDDALEARKDAAYAAPAHHLFVEPTLQAKVGHVVVRSKLLFERFDMDLQSGDAVFFDPTQDALLAPRGTVLSNDSDVLWMGERLVAGVRFSGVWPRYADADFGPGGRPAGFEGNTQLRVGPLVAYALSTTERTRFNRPTLLAIAGWHLKHPSREGGLPYLVLGFAFNSDLLGG